MKLVNQCSFDVIENITNDKRPLIILFHGFGADCRDLAPLSQVTPNASSYNWVFPDGPVSVPLGFGMVGKAWFSIDMMKLEQRLRSGLSESPYQDKAPDGFFEIAEKLIPLVEFYQQRFEHVYLGGFSQGSMIATEVALDSRIKAEGLIVLSGALVAKEHLEKKLGQKPQLPIFQSHGENDPILPFPQARTLSQIFSKEGRKHRFISFQGGHEIPANVLSELSAFIKGLQE